MENEYWKLCHIHFVFFPVCFSNSLLGNGSHYSKMFSYFEYNRVEDGHLSLEIKIKAKQIMVNFLFGFIGKVKAYITGIWAKRWEPN